MKTPDKMSREELIEYTGHLKRMIGNLQGQLTKALETIAEAHKNASEKKALPVPTATP